MTPCKVLCPSVRSWRVASCAGNSQADDSGPCHLVFSSLFCSVFLSRIVLFFRGNLPDTSAARRARWADRGWRTAACAVASRRSPGASASDPGLLSDSAMGHGQRNAAHQSSLSQPFAVTDDLVRHIGAETYPSDCSFCRLDEDGRLRVIVALERAPLGLAVTDFNRGKTHASSRQPHVFIRDDVHKMNNI